MLTSALMGSIPQTPSDHSLQLGLPGYLILFAPLAFAPQRQKWPREPPSPLVFLPISTHFTATPEVPFSSTTLEHRSIERNVRVEPLPLTPNLRNRLHALYAQ